MQLLTKCPHSTDRTQIYSVILITLIFFYSVQPWFLWRMNIIQTIFLFFYFILSIAKLKYKKFANISIITIFFFLYFIIFYLNKLFEIYSPLAFSFVFLFFFLNETKETLQKTFNTISNILAIIFTISLVFYLLHFIITFPYFKIAGRSVIADFYNNYIFNLEPTGGGDLRFRSIFDEPGIVGTISSFILFGNKYNFKINRNIIILIAGLFSMSLFFYLSTALFLIIFHIKSLKKLVLIFAILIAGTTIISKNKILNDLILTRLVFSNEKGISGNNRTNVDWDHEYASFLKSDDFLWGRGKGAFDTNIYNRAVASYQSIIFDYGLIGMIIIIIFYFIIFMNYSNLKSSLLMSLLLVLSLYQRPWIFDYYYDILTIAGLVFQNSLENHKFICNKIK